MPTPVRSLNEVLQKYASGFAVYFKNRNSEAGFKNVERYLGRRMSKLGRILGFDEGNFLKSSADEDVDRTIGFGLKSLTQEQDVENYKSRTWSDPNLGTAIVLHDNVTSRMMSDSAEFWFQTDGDSDIFKYTRKWVSNTDDNSPVQGTACVGLELTINKDSEEMPYYDLESKFGTYLWSKPDGRAYLNRIVLSGEPQDVKQNIEEAGRMLTEYYGYYERDGSGTYFPDEGFLYDSEDFPIRMALKMSQVQF